MATLSIIPVEGRRVRDPDTALPVTEPRHVPDSAFWRARIAAGDLIAAAAPAADPIAEETE